MRAHNHNVFVKVSQLETPSTGCSRTYKTRSFGFLVPMVVSPNKACNVSKRICLRKHEVATPSVEVVQKLPHKQVRVYPAKLFCTKFGFITQREGHLRECLLTERHFVQYPNAKCRLKTQSLGGGGKGGLLAAEDFEQKLASSPCEDLLSKCSGNQTECA